MSNVSVIGLGAMGSAIAEAELQAGHTVTVWNRSSILVHMNLAVCMTVDPLVYGMTF